MQTENTTQVYEAAITYAKRGWCVIPVHGIIAGTTDRCTCTWIDCPNPGKHPIEKDWPDTRLTLPDIYTTFVETYPYANVGVITGEPSGIFAIDIDPKNGGDLTLAALLLENGTLPDTYTQRSGSGGEHYLFNLPDFVVKGDSSRGEKAFGPGIDIRGHRNMIVMAGSRSDKGEYLPQTDFPTCVPPEWVEEKLRAHYTRTNNNEEDITVIEGLPEHSRLETHEQERAQKYAVRAIEAECLAYAQSAPGWGNRQLFKSACNILEIVQSPWNTVTLQNARDLLDRARLKRIEIHQYSGGQTPNEFSGVWRSARSTVAGQGRPYPENPSKALEFTYTPENETGKGKEKEEGEETENNEFIYEPEVTVPDGLPKTREMQRILKHLHDREQLDDILPPVPLISRVIDVGTSVVLAGSFGTFKTFASIGWACSVATGTPWLGHEVITPGTVLYIAAEGASGIKRRVAAWEKRTGVRVPKDKLWVIDVSVSIASDEDMKALIALAAHYDIKMVIFDTLHRCSSPLDENSNTDMGRLNVVAGAFREKNNITTVFVHHTGHDGKRIRGASSIGDDSDCAWIAKLTGDDESRDPRLPRLMMQTKTKDAPQLEPFFVRLDLVDGTESGWLELCDDRGQPIEGTAGLDDNPFEDAGYEPGIATVMDPDRIATGVGIIKQAFLDGFPNGSPATRAEIKTLARDSSRDHYISRNDQFYASWSKMVTGDSPMIARIGTTQKFRYLEPHERSLRLAEDGE